MAVGSTEWCVVVSSGTVEVVVVCPKDEALAEFFPQCIQSVDVWQLVQGDQSIVVGFSQHLFQGGRTVEGAQEYLAVTDIFAEPAPSHMRATASEKRCGLAGVSLDAAGEAGWPTDVEDVAVRH